MTRFQNGRLETDDQELRTEIALNCKEGVDPRSAIADWGDQDIDYSDREHSSGNGENRDDPGDISTPTFEQTCDRYDSYRPEDIRIPNR